MTIDALLVRKPSGKCAIAINPDKLETRADEKCKLAHELGHCETGSFYNRYAAIDLVERHERRAEKWAIKKLLPKQELIEAFKECHNYWEVAEMLDVTEELVAKAVEYYRQQDLGNN